MLSSPITVTIAGTAHSLIRINNDNFVTTYLKKGTGFEVKLVVRHSTEKPRKGAAPGEAPYERHNVELNYTTFPAGLPPATEQVYVVLRMKQGTDGTSIAALERALATFMGTNAAAILGWAG